MLDTGASLSVIKSEALPQHVEVHENNTVVNGIGGQIRSQGHVYLTLHTKNYESFRHKFHIFKNLPLKVDGIIGLDFLCCYKSSISLNSNTLTLYVNDRKCFIPIYETPDYTSNYLFIPARSESLHYVAVNSDLKGDCVICTRELGKDLYLGSAIVRIKDGKIPIRVLNVGSSDVQLPKFSPEVESLHNYTICMFNKDESNAKRANIMSSLLKLDHLNLEENKSIHAICKKYVDIFYLPGDRLNTTDIYQQSITLKPNVSPIYVKPYRLPQSVKPEIQKQIKNLLKDDIIEEATSAWSSPILLVPKKSDDKNEKKWRLVVDYRKLNENIQDDKFPLPNITDILDSLAGSIYFSHLDLYSGYYQVLLNPGDRKYTAFSTNSGHYQMKRLPMGLKISPSAFSRAMSIAMSGLTFEKCFIYLDDLIVFGRNLETHNKNLVDVFERLRKVNLKLNPIKCQFLKKELLYLGHVISSKGILPDPEKVTVVQNYPIPKNSDDVRRFVAFCNYYRKFIPSFANITIPLNRLSRKNIPFVWDSECQNSFDSLKSAMISPPILSYPDFSSDNEFILQTDASGIAIGAVLSNKDMRPIAYASRPLNKAELNYPTIQKELLAIVWGVKYFRPYLYGRRFTIRTDHKPLLYLFGIKDPSSRLVKFRLTLEEYDFKIEYVKGHENVSADALSRICISSDDLKRFNGHIITVLTRAQKKMIEDKQGNESERENLEANDMPFLNDSASNRTKEPRVVELLRKPLHTVEMILMKGNELNKIRKRNEITKEFECFIFILHRHILYINLDFKGQMSRAEFVLKLSNFCKQVNIDEICVVKQKENEDFIKDVTNEIRSTMNWSGPRINVVRGVTRIIDDEDKTHILNDFHLLPSSGHAGVRRMVNNIKLRFFWPGLETDVREFVKKCPKCQKSKYCKYVKEPMTLTTTATYAFEKIFLDIVGPLPRDHDGNIYILTIQCELSKFIEAYPLKNKETITVAKALVDNFILRFGVPKIIATDRGSEFMSSTIAEVCKLFKIEKICSTAYHHQSIGSLENAHKNLGSFLRIHCDRDKQSWSYWLPYWCFSFNTTVHTETKYQPFELVFGRICTIPVTLSSIEPMYNPENYCNELRYRLQVAHRDARNHLILSKCNRKLSYDKNINPIVYKKDDLILIKSETGGKLDELYQGPFVVLEDIGPNVKILKNKKVDVVHKNRTKKFVK